MMTIPVCVPVSRCSHGDVVSHKQGNFLPTFNQSCARVANSVAVFVVKSREKNKAEHRTASERHAYDDAPDLVSLECVAAICSYRGIAGRV